MTDTDQPAVRPFSNGTQFADWDNANCVVCEKSHLQQPDDGDINPCDIENALSNALFGDGMIPLPIAERMGYIGNEGEYTWKCREFKEVNL